MEAQNTINKLADKFETKKSNNDAYVAYDNYELHELLNDECVSFEEIMDQDTWIFSDGSYITRNTDEYWVGNDVDDFKVTAETC